jgi:type II secretory pathway predicted ATPase ExeA
MEGSLSTYLTHFALCHPPFDESEGTRVVIGTGAIREMRDSIRTGLEAGETRIGVLGDSGLGKTCLARALPKLLGNSFRVALLRDAGLAWSEADRHMTRQWDLTEREASSPLPSTDGRAPRLVLVIDQAERATAAFLDQLDSLLARGQEGTGPLVQSVLFARPDPVDSPLLDWLDRRHARQEGFPPLALEGVASYVDKRMRRAGWTGEPLFEEAAVHAIHQVARGIPGTISSLCSTHLVAAAQANLQKIDAAFVLDTRRENHSASPEGPPRGVERPTARPPRFGRALRALGAVALAMLLAGLLLRSYGRDVASLAGLGSPAPSAGEAPSAEPAFGAATARFETPIAPARGFLTAEERARPRAGRFEAEQMVDESGRSDAALVAEVPAGSEETRQPRDGWNPLTHPPSREASRKTGSLGKRPQGRLEEDDESPPAAVAPPRPSPEGPF